MTIKTFLLWSINENDRLFVCEKIKSGCYPDLIFSGLVAACRVEEIAMEKVKDHHET